MINDIQTYLIDIEKSKVDVLKKVNKTMGNKAFHLSVTKDGVFLNMSDMYEDACSVKVGEADAHIEIDHKYPLNLFAKLINENKSITIGERGALKTSFNGFDFYLLPQA